MQKTIWYIKRTARMAFFAVLSLAMGAVDGRAQPPGSGIFGNEWLTGKYSQDWLRIGVYKNGIQKVTLPVNFQNKSGQLHLYHRGAEVALISASNTEIEFYGILNDGASDALLYRPYTGTRANPYFSWYSDESAYFLTFSSVTSTKLVANQGNIALSGVPEPYHLEKELKAYTESDTYDGTQNLQHHGVSQSYLLEGKTRSSKIYGKLIGDIPYDNPIFPFPFRLKNLFIDPNRAPIIELLLNGRTFSNNIIKASIGKTATSLTDYSELIKFMDFIPFKKEYTINTSLDIDATGKGHFQLESTKVTDQSNTTGIFSVTYVRLIYPQVFNMQGTNYAMFNLIPNANSVSNLSISNAPAGAKVYDVTDPDNPRIVTGSFTGTTLNLMVARIANKELNLFVTNEAVNNEKVTSIAFTNYDPAGKDYLIVTAETLSGAASSYAAYRESTAGGSYRSLTVKIKDLYNQFNYGEPSPLAIRRFSDYMLSAGIRNTHNLLLVGNSIIPPIDSDSVLKNRELPDQVPTLGYHGSDVLLVSGVGGAPDDLPAIPVGRISANDAQQVLDYLSKVIEYEGDTTDREWRKKVLHLTGGGKYGERDRFKNFLDTQSATVISTPFSGNVTAKWKQNPDAFPTETVNISSEINAGVGVVSYYGHGHPLWTELDFGYVTTPDRGYQNSKKYPVMNFAACGVASIFNNKNTSLGKDWLLTPNKGAIAVIALSDYGWESVENKNIPILYNHIFNSSEETRGTIGSILKKVGEDMYTPANLTSYGYNISNGIHQRILLGDPALQILRNSAQCKPNLNVNGPVTAGANDHKQAQNFLVVTNTINSGAEANYHAGTEVVLATGFDALSGSVFRGYVEPCSGSDSTSARKGVEELAAASQENTDEPDLSVFPNPSNGLIKIGLKSIPTGTVEVFGTDGYKYVSESFYGQREVDVNIKKEKPGLYVIRVVSGNKVYTKTIVKF